MASEEIEPVLKTNKTIHISKKMYPDITFEETEPVLPIKAAANETPTFPSDETEPAIPVMKADDETPKDQIVAVIGETGRWQLEKILIVFLVSIPGLAHIFVSAFVAPKRDFWCAEELEMNVTAKEIPEDLKVDKLIVKRNF